MPRERAVVIGNGPSARLLDFDRLRTGDIASVGMNAAYRHWERIDFRPTHYICLDVQVTASHAQRIAALVREGRIGRFLLRDELKESCPDLSHHERILWFNQADRLDMPAFDSGAITTGSWAIRWMAAEGARLVATIGIDANYVEILPEARRLGQGADLRLEMGATPSFNPNYFFADYQRAGDRYNIPNDPARPAPTHIEALRAARDDLARVHPEACIVDCSPLSTHGLFGKSDLPLFFGEKPFRRPAKPALLQAALAQRYRGTALAESLGEIDPAYLHRMLEQGERAITRLEQEAASQVQADTLLILKDLLSLPSRRKAPKVAPAGPDEYTQRLRADRREKIRMVEHLTGEAAGLRQNLAEKDAVVARLAQELEAVMQDRDAKATVIARVAEELDAVQRDRAAKDAAMARLAQELEAVKQDREAKDVVIARLMGELEVVKADHTARGEVIERLVAELQSLKEKQPQ